MTKMKFKKRQIIKLYQGHAQCKLKGRTFTYVIGKNKEKLKKEVEDIQSFLDPSPEFKLFQDELEASRIKCANKDANGKPITKPTIVNGRQQMAYDIPNSEDIKSPFRKAVSDLEKKFEKAIKDHEDKMKEYESKFLDTEIDIDLLHVDFDDIPEDIGQDAMDGILPLIDRNAPDKK